MPVSLRRTTALVELDRLVTEADEGVPLWQLRASEFADELVHPLGVVLDRLGAKQVVEGDSPLCEFLSQAYDERFTRLTDDASRGGAGLSRDAEYFVLERLATADAGLAALLAAAPVPFRWALTADESRLARQLGRPYVTGDGAGLLGCVCAPARSAHLSARVERSSSGWRLSGASHPSVAGAAIATHAIVACTAAARAPCQAVALVPLERRGVQRVIPDGRHGLRAAAAARLVFRDVRLEHDELLSWTLAEGVAAIDHLAAAIGCVGIARAAYEGAARWCREHHVAAPQRLALMRATLGRTRGLTRAAHCQAQRQLDAGAVPHARNAALARTLASQTATTLARQATAIVGSEALRADGAAYLDGSRFRSEKLVRDAHEYAVIRSSDEHNLHDQQHQPRELRSATWAL